MGTLQFLDCRVEYDKVKGYVDCSEFMSMILHDMVYKTTEAYICTFYYYINADNLGEIESLIVFCERIGEVHRASALRGARDKCMPRPIENDPFFIVFDTREKVRISTLVREDDYLKMKWTRCTRAPYAAVDIWHNLRKYALQSFAHMYWYANSLSDREIESLYILNEVLNVPIVNSICELRMGPKIV